VYRVTIQAKVSGEVWKVVTVGTWTPGQVPQLVGQSLSAQIVEALFNIRPEADEKSGRNEIQDLETSYAVVFRRPYSRAWF
jgi:hypothetical protein